jgi:hypothetical protein
MKVTAKLRRVDDLMMSVLIRAALDDAEFV